MKTTTREAVQIPMTPGKGEVWFSINLGLIENIAALYALLYALKFDPKLAWIRSRTGVEVHALLHYEQRLEIHSPINLFEREKEILADVIDPDALRFVMGLTKVTV